MTSILFNINKYVLMEYLYSGSTNPDVIPTNTVGFRLISNLYNNQLTVVNDNNAGPLTKNIVDNCVQELNDHRYALIDRDSAYFYPLVDSNIEITDDLAITPELLPVYDTVRLHILSGYNFEDLHGFIFSIYARLNTDAMLRLCNTSYIKGDPGRLYFSPKPIKLAEFIYDKYLEIKIPSQKDMLEDQQATPGDTNLLSYRLSGDKGLADQRTIYCEFKNIRDYVPKDGLIYLEPDETVKFAFSSYDQYDLLVAKLQQASDGDYFEYYAEWDSNIIENYIYRLNSVAGNSFYIIHELRVYEQIGTTFEETDNFTSIQTSDYDKARTFRPVLKRGALATSFSIEYTARLYNSADGRSIFKKSSYTSYDISRYGKSGTLLNVGDTTQPLKIYNRLTGNPVFNIQENLLKITNTKMLSTFVNASSIRVKSDSDIDQSTDVLLQVVPFDNIYKFNLSTMEEVNDENSEKVFRFDDVSEYFMVFLKNDNSKYYISEFKSEQFDKSVGEIGFKLSGQQSQEVMNIKTNSIFYVTSKNPDGIETVIFSGKFQISITPSKTSITKATTNGETKLSNTVKTLPKSVKDISDLIPAEKKPAVRPLVPGTTNSTSSDIASA